MKALQKTLVLAAISAVVLVSAAPVQAELRVLSNGVPINNCSGSVRSMSLRRLYIPAGVTQLVITASGGQGDCDLYVRRERGFNQHWDFRSQSNSTNERVAILRPKEGWWQVGLLAPGAYSGVTLLVRFDNPRLLRRPQPRLVPRYRPQPDPKRHSTCDCGCKGDKNDHERRHRHRESARRLGGTDEFEPNSKRELAMQIFTGKSQVHTINPDGDEDWIMFVPRSSGRYVVDLTNVTIDLEGELWVQAGRDDEKRVEKFKVRRGRTGQIHLDVFPKIGYFKIKIEGDDNDDRGSYRLSVRQVSRSSHREIHRRRPDVYESNNKREAAIGIRENSTQLHTVYPRDDEDWMLFAPTRPGEYLLKISNVTEDLKGEVWVRRGDDKERRVDKFEVSRRGQTLHLHADHKVRYFKIKIEADDNDDTADYRVDVVTRSVRTAPTRRGPPILRRSKPTIFTPGWNPNRTTTYSRHSSLGEILLSRLTGLKRYGNR